MLLSLWIVVFVIFFIMSSADNMNQQALKRFCDPYGTGVITAERQKRFNEWMPKQYQELIQKDPFWTRPEFHGVITQDEADEILKWEEYGTYLIRTSVWRGELMISVVVEWNYELGEKYDCYGIRDLRNRPETNIVVLHLQINQAFKKERKSGYLWHPYVKQGTFLFQTLDLLLDDWKSILSKPLPVFSENSNSNSTF